MPLDLRLWYFTNCKEMELDLFPGFDIYFQLIPLNMGTSLVWQWVHIISMYNSMRQAEDEFQAILDYLVRPCTAKLKKEIQINKTCL